MMKLRLPPRNMSRYSNHHRSIFSNTLHIRYYNSILISHPYLPRRKLRLTHPILTCQRSLNIFHLLIPTHRTKYILRLLHFHRNMKHWNYSPIHSHSNCIHRLRTAMRTDILLRSNSNYKLTISYPIYWNYPC